MLVKCNFVNFFMFMFYVHRFGHLACFTSDVEMFVEVLSTDRKAELLEKLMKNSSALSAPPKKTLELSISLFKTKQLLLGDMFKCSESGGSHTSASECSITFIYSP